MNSMRKSSADEKILSYNDVVLRQSDLHILSGPRFLNDRIIEFYFSYLSTSHPSQDILLVPPLIAFWVANCPDTESLKEFLAPLKLPDRKLVIFPVNNNEDVNLAEGGTHWSLLAFERNANVFVHHDSCGGMNDRYARQLYETVVKFMNDPNSEWDTKYLGCPTSPQQVNFYDCGVYVIATAEAIYFWHGSTEKGDPDDLWFSAVKNKVTASAVAQMRKEILELIRGLIAKKKELLSQ